MRIFIATCTAFAVGLHLVLLQCVAWMGMVVMYTQQEDSLLDGLSMTFDGNHPCAMCHVIQAEQDKGSGEKNPTAPVSQKEIKLTQMSLIPVDWQLPQFPPATFGRHPARLGELRSLAHSPLEKPPQASV